MADNLLDIRNLKIEATVHPPSGESFDVTIVDGVSLTLQKGRVLGLISLTHRGAHATGLLLVSPLFAFVGAQAIFGAAAITVPLVGLAAFATAGAARARATRRSRRS